MLICIIIHIHTKVYIYVTINYVCVVSSRRNKTNPHHGINTFLFFKQLVYKHSSPNKHQLINHRESINKMFYRSSSCICWNIFNRIHFVAICDVLLYTIKFVLSCVHIHMYIMKVDEAASNNLHSNTYILHVHTAIQLHQYSSVSRTIVSSQHQHRSTRSLHSQPHQCKNWTSEFDNYEFAFTW